jgi:hypothetical protein
VGPDLTDEPTHIPSQNDGPDPNPAPPPGGPAVELALSTNRKIGLVAVLVAGLLLGLSVLADAIQVVDFLGGDGGTAPIVVVCSILILIPVAAALIYFVPKNPALFLFCVTGVAFAAVGSYFLGRLGGAPDPWVSQNGCAIKNFADDPGRRHDCVLLDLRAGQQVNLDAEQVSEWKASKDEADLRFDGGQIKPAHKGVSLAALSKTVVTDNVPDRSYGGCNRAQRSDLPIDVTDIEKDMVLCVVTDDWRVAVLDIVTADKSTFKAQVTCWQREK